MILKDTDEIISKLEDEKFKDTDIKSEMFNLGIEKAIEIIKNSPSVDAKIRVDRKTYHQNYYKNVTKLKRQRAKAANLNSKEKKQDTTGDIST